MLKSRYTQSPGRKPARLTTAKIIITIWSLQWNRQSVRFRRGSELFRSNRRKYYRLIPLSIFSISARITGV